MPGLYYDYISIIVFEIALEGTKIVKNFSA